MRIKIKYLNGSRFKRFIINSAQRINQMEQYLNDINVFPVADGDTGTNMVLTMASIVQGVKKCHESSFAEVSNVIADSALIGARGNSGAILAQFFQGLAEATRGKVRLSTEAFANAATKAAEQAKRAILHPQEGTIITVMKDWTNHLVKHSSHTPDFADLFKKSLSKARESLAETPNKLAVLKKANVVDAGAQGFVNLLEGIVDFIEFGKIRSTKVMNFATNKIKYFNLNNINNKINFQFCAECLIEGADLDRGNIRQKLSFLGNSLIVAGSENKVHIHIHTDKPEEVFDILSDYGTLIDSKVEDMYHQYNQMEKHNQLNTIGIVTDSTCDLPSDLIKEYNIQIVPIIIQVGKKSYLDRVEIQPKDFSHLLQTSNEKLSTSQPSPALFKKAYDEAALKYKSIISLHISEKLSGTIQGARVGCKDMEYSNKIYIIDSKTTCTALGLLAYKTAQWIRKGFELKEIIDRLGLAIKNTRLFVAVPTLKYIIRSGRLNKTKGFVGTLLNLKPVLTIDSQGYIIEGAKVIGQNRVIRKTLDMAIKYAKKVKNPYFGIAHIGAPELAERYSNEIRAHFNFSEIIIAEASPALSIHIGIGGVAIAVSGD
jgi:DegV family protein with EDD domain